MYLSIIWDCPKSCFPNFHFPEFMESVTSTLISHAEVAAESGKLEDTKAWENSKLQDWSQAGYILCYAEL